MTNPTREEIKIETVTTLDEVEPRFIWLAILAWWRGQPLRMINKDTRLSISSDFRGPLSIQHPLGDGPQK